MRQQVVGVGDVPAVVQKHVECASTAARTPLGCSQQGGKAGG